MADEPATPAEGQQQQSQQTPEPQQDTTDWKAESRKHEKRAKENHSRVQELEARLSEIENASKSDTEKALEKARKEARAEAEAELQKERRSDRLHVAVARHARDLADVDDVILNLERGDTDALFDKDGKVDNDALKAALKTLLSEKPHLKATGSKPQGDADAGKGESGGSTSFNDLMRASARR
jgi:hypothetical protein